MELWLTYALLTVLLYGLGEGVSKEPTVRLGSGRMLALYSVYNIVVYAGWFLLGRGWEAATPLGWAVAIASGASSALGTALWFRAIEVGNPSVVSGFAALYPVVTVVLATLALGAVLLPLQMVSIGLLVVSGAMVGVLRETEDRGEDHGWVLSMLLAVTLWGAAGVLEKIAITEVGLPGYAGGYLLIASPIFLLLARRGGKDRGPWNRRNIMAAQPALALFVLAGVTLILAVGSGPLVIVVPLTTTYPAVAIALRRFWKAERMTLAQKVAVGLAITGAVLVGL